MIAFLDGWHGFADAWLAAICERSVAAMVALAVVGAGLLALRRRSSAHAPSLLVLLPAAVLLAPVERLLPDAWPEPIPQVVLTALPDVAGGSAEDRKGSCGGDAGGPQAATGAAPEVHAAASPAAGAAPGEVLPSVPGRSKPQPDLQWPVSAWLLVAWAGVLVVGVGRLAFAHVRCERRLRRSGRAASAELQRLFDRLCSDRGFDGPIELRVVAGLASPVATGILRRSVCVPPGLDRGLTDTQLRFVLLHELEHHARRDVAIEGVLQVVRLAFWFHPAAWAVLALHRRWREFACDEAAIARCGSRKRAPAADALFTLIHLCNDAPHPSGVLASFAASKQVMKTRLTRILDRSRAPRRGLSAVGLLMLATTGIGALTVARAQQVPPVRAETPAPEKPSPQDPQGPVRVKVKVPDGGASATRAPRPDGEVAIAVDQGIAWLLANQQEDGSWSLGDAVDKPRDHNQVHITGLALRALLHGWKGPRHLDIVRAVERGDDYLKSTQNQDGLFGGGEAMAEHYGHAQVLRALAAIQRVIPEQERLDVIQRGVAFAEHVRNPYAGWRYRPRDGDNDSKHTALMLLALHDAKALGLQVPRDAFVGGRQTLDHLTTKNGRTGFTRPGEPMSRFVVKVDDFPKRFSEEPSAMRMLVEQAFADRKVDEVLLKKAAGIVRDMPPRWDVEAGTIDYAYWCFGARAMAAHDREHADIWRTALHEALLQSRVVDGGMAHWPAEDAWSYAGMEAYATASAVLSLCALP